LLQATSIKAIMGIKKKNLIFDPLAIPY